MRGLITVLTLSLGLMNYSQAHAQFLGDTFFETPSISAQNGDTVTLSAAAFTGVEIFGSADMAVSFESALFEVSEISFPENIMGVTSSETVNGITEIRIIAANGISFDKPTGIAPFVNITGKVLAEAGNTIIFNSNLKNVFLANKTEITNSSLGAEIVVAQPLSTAKVTPSHGKDKLIERTVAAQPGSSLFERAHRISPNGTNVTLAHEDGTYYKVILTSEER